MKRENISVSNEVYEEMLTTAHEAYPYEVCGILAGSGDRKMIDALYLAKNAYEGKKEFFYSIDPEELFRIEKRIMENGREVIGIYHSHPDQPAVMSDEDEKRMIPALVYIVSSVSTDCCSGIRAYMKDDPDGEIIPITIGRAEAA